MHIKRIRTLAGPNIFSHRPALMLRLAIDDEDERRMIENGGFAARIRDLATPLQPSDSSMRPIRTAHNDLAEAVKNTALSLFSRAGLRAAGASIRFSGDPGIFEIAVEYEQEEAARLLLETAVAAVEAALDDQTFDVAGALSKAQALAGGETAQDSPPKPRDKKIPIVAITGTNGKTTVTRLTAHTLLASGLNVGTTTTDGILLNGEIIERGDTTGPASARRILADEAVDVAVLETARGGIMRRGLGWEWADIAVITNITEDHIGQDGIESVADLTDIKSLVAERVRAGGTLILNAADPESAALANRKSVAQIKKRIVFFELSETHPILERHARAGETIYFVRGGWICEKRGESDATPIAETRLIPITMNGTADFQVQNALAVAAVCRALDLSPELIAAGFYGFRSALHNSGRSNFYRVGKGFALIDYGHNPKAMEAICRMTARWEGKTVTGIVSFPGDRRDDVIEAAGRIAAAGFDRIIIKGDVNLRGRERGEVAEMLRRIVLENGAQKECRIVLDAARAFDEAIAEIEENEVVVFFYEKLAPVMATLEKYGAVAADGFQAS